MKIDVINIEDKCLIPVHFNKDGVPMISFAGATFPDDKAIFEQEESSDLEDFGYDNYRLRKEESDHDAMEREFNRED